MDIPKDFRGLIKIVQDDDGVSMSLVNGEWRLKVPSAGLVRLRDRSPFFKFHSLRQPFPNGNEFVLPEGAIAYFSLWTEANDGSIWSFVGTHADYKKLQKDGPFYVDELFEAQLKERTSNDAIEPMR